MRPKPYVVIIVDGGVAECVLSVPGTGTPAVYIYDLDNIRGGDDLPNVPVDVANEIRKQNGALWRCILANT